MIINSNTDNCFSLLEYDSLKLLNKYDKVSSIIGVRDGKRTFDPIWPISVELHLTDVCNLDCRWCTDSNLKKNGASLNLEVIERLFREFKNDNVGVTLEGGGEPIFHPDFEKIVRYAGDIGIDLGLITNGTRDISDLTKYFKWIRISIDATSPDEYKHEKGKDLFYKVIDNLKNINSARKHSDTLLGVGYVITNDNDDNIHNFIGLLDSIGIDYIYLRPVEESAENLPDFERLYQLHKNLIRNEDKYRIKVILRIEERVVKNNNNLPCIAHSLTCVIRANGDVVMCEKRRHDIKIFGNVNEKAFNDIWLSEKRKNVSRLLLNHELSKGCEVCRLTRYNKIFYDLKNLKTSNFI